MVVESFLSMTGLGGSVGFHIYLYFTAIQENGVMQNLLEKEKRPLIDSMLVVGALQVLYFLWLHFSLFFPFETAVIQLARNVTGLVLLVIFAYVSRELVENMKEVEETYGFEPGVFE